MARLQVKYNEEIAPAPQPQMTGWWARMMPKRAAFKITLKPHSYKAYSY